MTNKSASPVLDEINRALNLCTKGQYEKAAAIVASLPSPLADERELRLQFGKLCIALKNFSSAVIVFTELNQKYPDNPDYLFFLGDASKETGKLVESQKYLERCLEIAPDDWRAHSSLGGVFIKLEHYDQALEYLEKAIELKPSHANSYSNMAICHMRLGQHEESVAYSKKAIKLDPHNIHPYNNLGYALSELGRTEEAEEYFKKAIKIDRLFGIVYLNYSRIKKFSEKDSAMIKKMESLLKESMPAVHRSNFHFSLGKIYDDCKEWNKAFEHYRQGNLLGKSGFSEAPIPDSLIRKFRKLFTPEMIQKLSSELGSQSEVPVFIVGMPRSGTTLLEQIISSHEQAEGAGELTKIGQLNHDIYDYENLKSFQQDWQQVLNKEHFTQYAEEYLSILRQGNQDALRVVDKMPENYFHLGFLSILFPKARFVHSIRNPIDTCLSCYFTSFSHITWAYDFEWIVNRYRIYRKVMEFWESVLPEGSILDIKYEDLVDEPEQNSRRLIDHIGLEWDPNCLDFHEKKRAVQTASVWQVRQPIYKQSVRRWQNYSGHIEQLASLLGEYLDDYDIEALSKAGIEIKPKRWWKIFN